MHDKPTIREQWQEYRKTACEWCAVHLNHEGKGDAKATDVLPQSSPNFVHKVYPPLCAGKLSQYLRCTAMPFEDWAEWKIRHFTDVLRALRTEQLGPEEWGIKCIQDHNDIIAEALAAQPESGVKES